MDLVDEGAGLAARAAAVVGGEVSLRAGELCEQCALDPGGQSEGLHRGDDIPDRRVGRGAPNVVLTAIPSGPVPAATVAGLLGDSAPPAPTVYCETLPPGPPSALLVTQTLLPSGLTATSTGKGPAATIAGLLSASTPLAPTSNCATHRPSSGPRVT